MSVAALVLGAGSGARMRASVAEGTAASLPPKAFLVLDGQTLFERSLRALAAVPEVGWIQPVFPKDAAGSWGAVATALGDLGGRLAPPVEGGAERSDSVRAGLAALPEEIDIVAIHDAARPLVDPADVAAVVSAASKSGAAFLGAPLADTIHRLEDGRVVETPDRAACIAAQTPQAFRRDWLEAAHAGPRADGAAATDDVMLVAELGHAVQAVTATAPNPKITTALDLEVALAILRERDARARGPGSR